jgi:alpha-beta hydrolase superfamily lysophospholipase
VLTFDHRGVGRSGGGGPHNQTARQLAREALFMIDAVWGHEAEVHVYG